MPSESGWLDGLKFKENGDPVVPREVSAKNLEPTRLTFRDLKVRRDPKREPRVSTMFKQRMQREGRGQELNERVRAVSRETGMGYASALHVVMPQMGFLNSESEIRLYRQHRRKCYESDLEEGLRVSAEREELSKAERAEEESHARLEEEFERALSQLPSNAKKWQELEWIEAHPAMMRESRMRAIGKDGPVVITAEDILNAPHGVCPSRAAAVQLQHWANNSVKFFEQIMSEAKKKSSDGSGDEKKSGEVEDDLSEIEGLLDF